MTKNEQNRVVAWRLKIIRQASELQAICCFRLYVKTKIRQLLIIDI
jgi:hypothetical protein